MEVLAMVCRIAIPSGNAVKSEHSTEWQEPFLVYMYELINMFIVDHEEAGGFLSEVPLHQHSTI